MAQKKKTPKKCVTEEKEDDEVLDDNIWGDGKTDDDAVDSDYGEDGGCE